MDNFDEKLHKILDELNKRLYPWLLEEDLCQIKAGKGCKKYRECETKNLQGACWEKRGLVWCDYDSAIRKPYGASCRAYKGFCKYNCPSEKQTMRGKSYRNCAPSCPFFGCVTSKDNNKLKISDNPCPYAPEYFTRIPSLRCLHSYHLFYCYLTSKDFIEYQTKHLQLHMGLFTFLDFHPERKTVNYYYLVKHPLGNCHFYFAKYDEQNGFIFDEKEHLKSCCFQFTRDYEIQKEDTLKLAFDKQLAPTIFFTPDGVVSLYCFAYLIKRVISGVPNTNLERFDVKLTVDDKEKNLIQTLKQYGMDNEYLEYMYDGGSYNYETDDISGICWIHLLKLLGFVDNHGHTTERFYRFLDEGLLSTLSNMHESSNLEHIKNEYLTSKALSSEHLQLLFKVIDKNFTDSRDVQEKAPFSTLPHLCLRAFETTSRSHVGIPVLEKDERIAGYFLGTVKDSYENKNVNSFASRLDKTARIRRLKSLERLVNGVAKAEINDPFYSMIFERTAWLSLQLNKEFEVIKKEGAIPTRDKKYPFYITKQESLQKEIVKIFSIYAPKPVPILITGETGTGKEIVARGIHHHSGRNKGEFVAVNIASFSEAQLEAELFGAERGAWAGGSPREGCFRRADKGTLFLDEIGKMSITQQSCLLRAIQEKEVQVIGGNCVSVDVRIIAATDINIKKAIESENFDKPLYARLSTNYELLLPPLRKRKEDIPLLVKYFTSIFCEMYNISPFAYSKPAINRLMEHPWTLNIRE